MADGCHAYTKRTLLCNGRSESAINDIRSTEVWHTKARVWKIYVDFVVDICSFNIFFQSFRVLNKTYNSLQSRGWSWAPSRLAATLLIGWRLCRLVLVRSTYVSWGKHSARAISPQPECPLPLLAGTPPGTGKGVNSSLQRVTNLNA
jgi:hypothetical protein